MKILWKVKCYRVCKGKMKEEGEAWGGWGTK